MKVIVEYSRLQAFLDVALALVDEAKLRCNEDHLRIVACDPAQVGMVDATLDSAGCESFDTGGETLGISLTKFDETLQFASSGDLVLLNLNTETKKLDIEYDGFEASVALIDPDSIRQEPDVPELNLPASVRVPGWKLERGVKGSDMVSDHLRLVADVNEKTFRAKASGDTDDVDIELDDEEMMVDVSESAESLFSVEYCLELIKPINSDTEVLVKIGTEMPTKWWYQLHDGDIAVTNMLAPRMETR